MIRPSDMTIYPKRDLKLGIKSSLPNPKSALGLFLLIWEVSEKQSSIEYADEDDGKLKIKENIFTKIVELKEFNDGRTKLEEIISTNSLLTSQIEALIVAFELVWCLGKFEFSNGMSVTSERTGGERFSKKIFFTSNLDIIDSAFFNTKAEYRKTLLKWLGCNIAADAIVEQNLVKLLTIMSENSVYKLKDGTKDVIFNNLSIYKKLFTESEIDIKGDEEAKGSLRILLSELKESLNYNLKYVNGKVTLDSIDVNKFKNYSDRVNTFLLLSNDKTQFQVKEKKNSDELITHSLNRIIFGAPGTGKSHKLNLEAKEEFGEIFERVTFHLNYSYAQFVGTYKPVSEKKKISNTTEESKEIVAVLQDENKTAQEKYDLLYDKFKDNSLTRLPLLLGLYCDDDFKTKKKDGTSAANDNNVESNHGRAIRPYVTLGIENTASSEISYEYVPGPFIRTYIKAIKEKMKAEKDGSEPKNYLLLIEEINRANVAAVFGDVFQLLDRNAAGESEYPVAAGEDIKKYLLSKGISCNELKIPSNMYIWATMNSADQGVMPMDAAFKRRWDFEYIDIDEGESDIKDIVIPIPDGAGEDKKIKWENINWNELRTAINSTLKTIPGVNEDKLLGPFFIGNKEKIEGLKKDNENFNKLFKSKVLMYLFEDVVKMNPGDLFNINEGENIHYSDICRKFDEQGLKVFVKSISDKFPEAKTGESN